MSGLPSLLPLNRQRIIKSKVEKYVFPFIQCQCFDKRRGDFFTGKSQRFFLIRVFFWPEISALGESFNFDNERMYPPIYQSAPTPGTHAQSHTQTFGRTHARVFVRTYVCMCVCMFFVSIHLCVYMWHYVSRLGMTNCSIGRITKYVLNLTLRTFFFTKKLALPHYHPLFMIHLYQRHHSRNLMRNFRKLIVRTEYIH